MILRRHIVIKGMRLGAWLRRELFPIYALFLIVVYPFKLTNYNIKWLHSKRILILGTGPSLDLLTDEMLANYELIVFLNGAIRISSQLNFKGKKKIFFCTDLHAFRVYKDDILQLELDWLFIVVPLFFREFPSQLRMLLRRKAYLLMPYFSLFGFAGDFGFNQSRRFCASFIGYKYVKRCARVTLKIPFFFRPFPRSVALNAVWFALLAKVSCIHYLGCDMFDSLQPSDNGPKNSRVLNIAPAQATPDRRAKIHQWFRLLKYIAVKNNIELANSPHSCDPL